MATMCDSPVEFKPTSAYFGSRPSTFKIDCKCGKVNQYDLFTTSSTQSCVACGKVLLRTRWCKTHGPYFQQITQEKDICAECPLDLGNYLRGSFSEGFRTSCRCRAYTLPYNVFGAAKRQRISCLTCGNCGWNIHFVKCNNESCSRMLFSPGNSGYTCCVNHRE